MNPRSPILAGFLTALLWLAFSGSASAAAPVMHEQMVQIPGVPCSVTAWDYFTTVKGQYTMDYGGGTSCADNAGQKTIDVVPQVFNVVDGQAIWFSIGGDGLFQGPTPISPLRLGSSRAAVASHLYRVLVYAEVARTNTRVAFATACAACNGTSPTLSIAWPRGFIYTWPPKAVPVPGLNCTVFVNTTSFPNINNSPVMNYSGSLACGPTVPGVKQLMIAVQTAGGGKYFTVTGSTLWSSPTTAGSVYLNTARTVYIGHPYRVMVTGSITINGRTTSVTAYSLTAGP